MRFLTLSTLIALILIVSMAAAQNVTYQKGPILDIQRGTAFSEDM